MINETWYKMALAAVSGLYWFAASKQIIPSAENWEIRVAALGFFLFGLLWIANVVASVISLCQPRQWLAHWITQRREQARVRNYIPHMSGKDREIIGYLLARNQKLFMAAHDGGYAMPLISQRIVRNALQPGQLFEFSGEHTPMLIPDHIWNVLLAHKEQFPYASPSGGEVETPPWSCSSFETRA